MGLGFNGCMSGWIMAWAVGTMTQHVTYLQEDRGIE